VLLSNVEQMSVTTDDIARRFINMVDEFYDRNVKLIISAEVELKDLYTGGRLNFEFQRTLSRLLEMQSHEFLARTSLNGSWKPSCKPAKAETVRDCSGFLKRC
jgi:cell division protein ZapE